MTSLARKDLLLEWAHISTLHVDMVLNPRTEILQEFMFSSHTESGPRDDDGQLEAKCDRRLQALDIKNL